ncbi:MAG: response regulator [Myxococcales bacterium]|jgi:two-component system chemotaxis response regulator CheY|nr:response regulator [Myxococcales bacterium]
MRLILRKHLIALGFEVLEAGHGREALAALDGMSDVDLALVDVNMPEMGGVELVAALRKQQALASLRVLMVSSEQDFDTMQAALEAGANDYLMKPFTPDGLMSKLELLGISKG